MTNSELKAHIEEIKKNGVTCVFCGKKFLQKKMGRKRDFCSSDCQICNKHWNNFQRDLEKIKFTPIGIKHLRGDLMALSSELGAKSYLVDEN